jgi:hypothetical protein
MLGMIGRRLLWTGLARLLGRGTARNMRLARKAARIARRLR